MITETIGKYTIKRHDDINELIVENYNLFNEFAIYDAEVGCSMESIEKLFQKIDFFLANKKMEDALQARKNLHQSFFHLFQHNNFPAMQWIALVHSVDGQEIKDYSLQAIKDLIEQLSKAGLTQGKVLADVESAKKKSVFN